MRNYVERKVQNRTDLFNAHSAAAKQLLHQHLTTVTMHPVKDSSRGWYYEAEGTWNLLGRDENAPREETIAQDSNEGQLRMVAGAGFEPATFGL